MATNKLIRDGRKRLGMTEQQFADAVGVSRGAVQQWERGDTAPKRNNQAIVARKLGISVAALMEIEGSEGPRDRASAYPDPSPPHPQYASESAATYRTDPHTAELLNLFNRLSQVGQSEAIEYLRYLARRHGAAAPSPGT